MIRSSMFAVSAAFSLLAVGGAIGQQSAGETTTDQEITGAIGAGSQNGESFEAEIVSLPSWQAERLYAGGFSVEQLIGADVYTEEGGSDRGDVENVVFDNDGNILSVVAEIGGLFELGDTHVNIPWDQVQYNPATRRITVPLTADNVAQYSVFADPILSSFEAAGDVAEVTGDGPGEVGLGPRAFRATDFLQDYARLIDDGNWVNYGYVDDIIVRDGKIAAVVVRPDVSWGARGPYAYPYYGYPYGWTPGSPYYDLPYQRGDIDRLEPMDYASIE
jgi:sporulation protein YlmC with PRC-barrel domain